MSACSSNPNEPVVGADAGLSASLENIQEYIFDVACVQCHNELNPSGGLDLSSAQVSYDNLVDVSAANAVAGENGWMRVKPGDAELSFLIRKLAPGLGEGAPMPLGNQQITPFYVDLMKNWIASGAQR
ncbi:MAG: hypothetical protein JKY56_02885 [Kofleriaceae bacterium]|nr:hypothetical protein [Kofleriaceae bacterium]